MNSTRQNKRKIENLYKELLSDDIESLGFNFVKSTFQKKATKKLLSDMIPESWEKIYFKSYPRLPHISLEETNPNENPLFSVLKERKSEREFEGKNLTLKTISNILYFSSGIRNFNEIKNDFDSSLRAYPSAGARYPLEIYFALLRSEEIPLGIYHYNVKRNSIELLLEGNFEEEFVKISDQDWIQKSGMIVIITAVFSRTAMKYKERGWRYIFFEAGHVAQNIHLISTNLKLKCCAIGGFLDREVIQFLDLNPKSEFPLYLVAIGK